MSSGAGWPRPRLLVSPWPASRVEADEGGGTSAQRLRVLAAHAELLPAEAASGDGGLRPDGIVLGDPRLTESWVLRYPATPVAYEGRLRDESAWRHFLTRIYQGARLRTLPATAAALVTFHASSKLLLLAYSEIGLRELGRIVANEMGLPLPVVRLRYAETFARALSRPAATGALVNALQHAIGHIAPRIGSADRHAVLAELTTAARDGGSHERALRRIRSWSEQHGTVWLTEQSLFRPFPERLIEPSDSFLEAPA